MQTPTITRAREVLLEHFGYAAFYTGQEALIEQILAGRDVLGIMPTGAGKSVCYQIPALLLSGMTVVVSPLISLMKDQVDGLRRMGIPAAFLNSSLTGRELDETYEALAHNAIRLLYIAPERLEAEGFVHIWRDWASPWSRWTKPTAFPSGATTSGPATGASGR